jgi:hypothetical protein
VIANTRNALRNAAQDFASMRVAAVRGGKTPSAIPHFERTLQFESAGSIVRCDKDVTGTIFPWPPKIC